LLSCQADAFKTALAATGLALGFFAIWHILRLPWLLHKSVHAQGEPQPGWGAGVFGVVIIVGLLTGGYVCALQWWNLRPLGIIKTEIKTPPPPVFQQERIVTVHGACKLTAEQINPAKAAQPCPVAPPPTLRDRVLAINAHLTEADRNRFSIALSEFEASLKEGESIFYKLADEGNTLNRERQDGTIAKDVQAQQKALSDIAANGWKYYRALSLSWVQLVYRLQAVQLTAAFISF